MLKEEFEELIKREVNENKYKNIETAYEALPEYMDKMYLASAISNDIGINRREGNSGIHSKRRAAIVGTR